MIWIVFFDTLYTIPLAKLRLEERPRKYAFINVFAVVAEYPHYLILSIMWHARRMSRGRTRSWRCYTIRV